MQFLGHVQLNTADSVVTRTVHGDHHGGMHLWEEAFKQTS